MVPFISLCVANTVPEELITGESNGRQLGSSGAGKHSHCRKNYPGGLRNALKSLRRMCQRYRTFKGNSGAEGGMSQSLWYWSVTILYIRLESEYPYPMTATKMATSAWTHAWEYFPAKARTIIWTQYLQQIMLCSGSRTTIGKFCMAVILSFLCIYLHTYPPFNKLIHPSIQIFVYYKKN